MRVKNEKAWADAINALDDDKDRAIPYYQAEVLAYQLENFMAGGGFREEVIPGWLSTRTVPCSFTLIQVFSDAKRRRDLWPFVQGAESFKVLTEHWIYGDRLPKGFLSLKTVLDYANEADKAADVVSVRESDEEKVEELDVAAEVEQTKAEVEQTNKAICKGLGVDEKHLKPEEVEEKPKSLWGDLGEAIIKNVRFGQDRISAEKCGNFLFWRKATFHSRRGSETVYLPCTKTGKFHTKVVDDKERMPFVYGRGGVIFQTFPKRIRSSSAPFPYSDMPLPPPKPKTDKDPKRFRKHAKHSKFKTLSGTEF
jgi:hypothetical protein